MEAGNLGDEAPPSVLTVHDVSRFIDAAVLAWPKRPSVRRAQAALHALLPRLEELGLRDDVLSLYARRGHVAGALRPTVPDVDVSLTRVFSIPRVTRCLVTGSDGGAYRGVADSDSEEDSEEEEEEQEQEDSEDDGDTVVVRDTSEGGSEDGWVGRRVTSARERQLARELDALAGRVAVLRGRVTALSVLGGVAALAALGLAASLVARQGGTLRPACA